MAVDVGSAVGYLDLDISGFLKKLKEAKEQGGKEVKGIEDKFKSVGSTFSNVGSTLSKGVTVPLLGVGTAGLKVATDFEKSMSGVKAITRATDDDFQKLRDTAIDLGANTAFSSQEVANGMTEMAKAGWSTEQIIDGMSGVLDAAAASGEELGTVSTIVADAITGFGLEASESTKVADLLTQAANSGTIGINDLGESFKYIAPVAGSLGYSIDDVTTAIAAMSMAGIKGSQAGTALRTLLTNMANPTDTMAAAMDELGVSLYDGEGKMYSLKEVLDQLRSGMGDLMVSNEEYKNALSELDAQLSSGEITQNQYNTAVEDLTRKTFGAEEAEKARAAAMLAGKEGMSGLLSITNMTQEEYDKLSESMENSSGVADETAAVMQDNLQSKVEQLGGSLESLAIKLGDYVIPKLTEWAGKLTELVDKFISLDPNTQKFILTLAGIVAAAGPVILIIGKLITAIGAIIKAVKAVPAVMASIGKGLAIVKTALLGVSAPMWIIIGVIAVLVAAFTTLWNTNEEFRNNIIGIWNEIKTTFDNFTQGIVDRLNALGFDFENITDVIWAIWEGFCNLLAPVFEGVFQNIANTFEMITGVITGLLDIFIGLFTGNWEQFWTGIQEVFGSIWEGIVSTFENIWNTIVGIADVILGWFGTSWNELWTNVGNFFVNLWNGIVTWWNNLWNSIFTFFTNLINSIINFFTVTIPEALNQFVNFIATLPERIGYLIGFIIGSIVKAGIDAWNAIVQFGTNLWNWITVELPKIIASIIDWFAQLPGRIWEWLVNVVNDIGKWGTDLYNSATEAVSDAIDAVVEWFTELPGRIWEWLTNVVNDIGQWGTDLYNSAEKAVSDTIDGIGEWFSDLPEDLLKIGEDIIKGLWDGINGMGEWLWEQISGFAGGIVDGFKSALGIHSPSKVMASLVGAYLPSGIAMGFAEKMPKAARDMKAELNSGLSELQDNAGVDVEVNTKVNTFANTLKGFYDSISGWFTLIIDKFENTVEMMTESIENLDSISKSLIPVYDSGVYSNSVSNKDFIDYEKIADIVIKVLKKSPIEFNPEFIFEKGDIYLDKDKVGKSLDTKLKQIQDRRKRG